MKDASLVDNEDLSHRYSHNQLANILLFILLFNLASLGQVVSDIYLPALPTLSHALKTSVHAVQLSISWYFCGFAISHLFYGPISDSVGRKLPLVVGLTICIIGCLICALTTSIHLFYFGRLLQGLGTGASATLYRSILRDVHSGKKLAAYSSYIGIGRVFLLASAPLIGAYLLNYFNWRAIFDFLFIYSLLCLLGTLFTLKETCHYASSKMLSIKSIMGDVKQLITSPSFMGYTLCIMLTFGSIISWLSSIPIILQREVGLSAIQFGWVAALSGAFFIVGGVINAFAVNRFGIKVMLYAGLFISLAAGIIMLLFASLGYINTFVIVAPITLYIIGASSIFPNAYTGAFDPFPKIAGIASAVFGFLQMLGGVISSLVMSYLHTNSQQPLAIMLTLGSFLMILIIMFTTRNKHSVPA